MAEQTGNNTVLIDRFNRRVNYVRMSITDRCDFRCVYCMDEEMTFMPRDQLLSLEEIVSLLTAFAELGVEKIRVTGGEPLVRQGVDWLFKELGAWKQTTG
jgi:cyclic pyranopterin phosphate synthase